MADLQHVRVHVRHADQVAVAERRGGIEDVVGGERAVDAVLHQEIGIRHAAPDAVVLVAPHEVEVGRRQHRDGDPDVVQASRQLRQARRRQQRKLRHVPGDHAPAELVFLRELADEVDQHVVGGGTDVEMQVDVDVEFPTELEDAPDLAAGIAVVARRAADRLDAAPERLHQQFLGAGTADESFLGKDADLHVDGPGIIRDQGMDGVEAAHADAGIDLDLGAHAGGAVENAFLEGPRRPCPSILHREARLQWRHALHGIDLAALGRRAAVDDPGLVEVDMGLDEAGADEAAAGVVGFSLGGEAAPEGGDAPVLDGDIERGLGGGGREAGVTDDQIQAHGSPRATGRRAGSHSPLRLGKP